MKENVSSIKISSVALIISIICILGLPEDSNIQKIVMAILGGEVVSILVSVVNYKIVERKSIYDFYMTIEKYAEEIGKFSRYLIKISESKSKEELLNLAIEKSEKISEKINEIFFDIQRETREFEAYAIKMGKASDIAYYMRETYKGMKEEIKYIKYCEEICGYKEVDKSTYIKEVPWMFSMLFDIFIKEEEKEYTLVRYGALCEVLNTFIKNKYIPLRGGIVKYNMKLEKKCEETVHTRENENQRVTNEEEFKRRLQEILNPEMSVGVY